MEDAWVLGFLGIPGVVILVVLLAGWGVFEAGRFTEREEWRAELIERDLGVYCPADGGFAWKGECGSAKP